MNKLLKINSLHTCIKSYIHDIININKFGLNDMINEVAGLGIIH